MAVPFIDLRRFESDFLDRWLERCRELTVATQFVGGPPVADFEKRMSSLCETSHAIGCANGTDALQLALRAAGVGPGDRVLLPDATFWASLEAVVNCGAQPVTVDIEDADLQMDFELFQQAVETYRPKAAILVHLYGWGSRHLQAYRAFCRRQGIVLIEDGAQVCGSLIDGRSIFAECHLATLSFYPAKVLGANSDAGMVLCQDDDLAATIRQLGNHGRSSHYGHTEVGWNSRMGGFEAAFLNLSLDYLPERLESRRQAAEQYRTRLTEMGVRCAAPPAGHQENGYLNVTLHSPQGRQRLEETLKQRQIGYGNVYPSSVSQQPAAAKVLAGTLGGDRAEALAKGVLNLPLFAHIRREEIDEVVEAVANYLERMPA